MNNVGSSLWRRLCVGPTDLLFLKDLDTKLQAILYSKTLENILEVENQLF